MADPKQDSPPDEAKASEADERDEAAAERRARRKARRKAREEARAAEEAEAAPKDEGDEGEASEGDEDEGSEGDESAEASEGDEGAEASEGDEPAKPNRRERRRRKKLGDEAAEPRDRNARVRAQLLKKKKAEEEQELQPLTTGEMIDDALARGTARVGKWAKQNSNLLQGLVLALLLGGAAYGVYFWQSSTKAEQASTDLMAGVQADRGRVDPAGAPKASEEEEILPVYKTPAERTGTALAAYRKARSDRDGSGTTILARLGEAGMLLDQRSYDEALTAYREVKASPLAAADPDVRGRAIEGIGFALEGKGDNEAALKAYKELDTITNLKGYKELGMYHQARLLAAKGDRDAALKLLKEGRERLQTTGDSRNATYLVGVMDELSRKLDPSAAPRRQVGGAGRQMSAEELQKLQQQMMREMQKAKEKSEHHDEQDEH